MSTWTCRVTALLVMLVVALVGGLALAQDAPPPGPPSPQGPSSEPGTPVAPGQTGGSGQPDTPGFQQTIQGDTAAWAEIQTAYKKRDSLSYRMKEMSAGNSAMDLALGRTVTILEFTPPNSVHLTRETSAHRGIPPTLDSGPITIPAISVEMVTANHQTRIRTKRDGEAWGPWECHKEAPRANTKGVSVQSTVEVSRGPDTIIEGTPVRTYVYTDVGVLTFPDQRQRTVTQKVTVYVDTQTGLPRRKVNVSKSNNLELPTMTTDYYDYDAKIEITLPPCG